MRLRKTTAAAAAAVLLAACGGTDGDADTTPDAQTGTETETDAGTDADAEGEPESLGDLDLPDADEFIADGEFRGQGVVMPIPDGWTVDDMALVQGLVAASADEDQTQQLVAQAIDTADLGDDQQVTFEDLLEVQRTQFAPVDPDLEATVDEAVEIDGATSAHRLRFEQVQIDEQPAFDLELVLAEDGDGRIALFNYAAPSEAFDDAVAELMMDGIGIDPDSEPPAPQAPAVPQDDAGAPDDDAGAPGDDAGASDEG